MKIKLFFFFLLAVTVQGFSQEKTIEIQPQKEFLNSVILAPACGKGNEMELPFTVFWDKKAETVKIDFKSNTAADKVLFLFPKRMFIKKEVMKLRKEVAFAKEVKKCQIKGTVNTGIDTKKLVNVEEPTLDSIQTLDCGNSNASMSFLFKKAFQNNGDIVIPFHFYVASKETSKKARNRKIEYETELTLIIKKHTETAPSKKVVPTDPKPKTPSKPLPETVNCKALYKANEQLTELLLDIKNSTSSNLTPFKQKYETIKKSVANPEYKKCKEEYKTFESLCVKIENRLK